VKSPDPRAARDQWTAEFANLAAPGNNGAQVIVVEELWNTHHQLPTSLYQKVIHFIKGIPPYFGLKCVVTSLYELSTLLKMYTQSILVKLEHLPNN